MQVDEEKLKEALKRPAALGRDIDLREYSLESAEKAEIDEDVVRRSLEVGVDLDKRELLTTFLQIDHDVLYKAVQKQFQRDIELLPLEEAFMKYDWLKNYVWKLRSPYEDKYTAFNALHGRGGFFLRILKGRKLYMPIQACFLAYSRGILQNVHNIIVAEPGSEAYIITGCTAHKLSQKTLHIGVTEIFVRSSAKLNYTMIHKWGSGSHVRPRTGILLEDEAKMVYNYVILGSVGSFQSQPSARLEGGDAVLSMNNIVYLDGFSDMDLGGEIWIGGEGGKAELLTNAVTAEKARLVSRGKIVSEAEGGRGHISCRGLMLSDDSEVSAIPCLISRKMRSELTHEAAIGKISEDQLFYLMSRGLSREEAESLIVRGFLDTAPMNLPKFLEEGVKKIIGMSVKGF